MFDIAETFLSMEEQFTVNGTKCTVNLNAGILLFRKCNEKKTKLGQSFILSIKSILSVTYESRESRPSVHVEHVVQHANHVLRRETCVISGEEEECKTLAESLQQKVNELTRPKRLLVFVNPKSGHKKGVKIYKSKVAPLLSKCGIYTEVIVTERPGQPIELLETYDLSLIHGIVSVGGDGMFSECVNGLLTRIQNDSNVDMNDPDADIIASKIPIGIVPAGSGNYLLNYIHGTKDLETAVLKIILGDHHMSNVVSIHQGRQITCYASLVAEFGLFGKMMHDCEKFRWMGPSRYNCIPLTTLAKRKSVDVKIEYLPEEEHQNSPKPYIIPYRRQESMPANKFNKMYLRQRMLSSPDGYMFMSDKKQGWKTLEGQVYGVDTYVVTQREKGDKLVPRFGDSALTLWTTEKCSMLDHVEQLTKLNKGQSGFLDYDFVRKVRVTRYRIKLPSAETFTDKNGIRTVKGKYYMNADGEAIRLETPEVEVKLHACAVPIYGKVDG